MKIFIDKSDVQCIKRIALLSVSNLYTNKCSFMTNTEIYLYLSDKMDNELKLRLDELFAAIDKYHEFYVKLGIEDENNSVAELSATEKAELSDVIRERFIKRDAFQKRIDELKLERFEKIQDE